SKKGTHLDQKKAVAFSRYINHRYHVKGDTPFFSIPVIHVTQKHYSFVMQIQLVTMRAAGDKQPRAASHRYLRDILLIDTMYICMTACLIVNVSPSPKALASSILALANAVVNTYSRYI